MAIAGALVQWLRDNLGLISSASEIEDLNQNRSIDKTWEPSMSPETREEGIKGWRKAVERTLNWVE